MKSKVKFTALILVIGLLSLVILPSSVFGGGKTTYLYEITVTIDDEEFPMFTAAGNRNGTKIGGDGKFQQGMVDVEMYFTKNVVEKLNSAQDDSPSFNDYPGDRPLYWSPLEDDWLELGLEDNGDQFYTGKERFNHLQDLNSNEYNQWWKYHSGGLDYRKNTLSFRFDMFYIYQDGDGRKAHDHYILGIEMNFYTLEEDPYTYYSDGLATLNWTHYTEPIKARGKNLQVDFQHLKCTCYFPVIITILPLSSE